MGNTLVACCQPAGKETSVVSLRLTRRLSIVRKEKEKLSVCEKLPDPGNPRVEEEAVPVTSSNNVETIIEETSEEED